MINKLIGAFFVLRLECRQLPLDLEQVLAWWRQRPVIEIVIEARQSHQHSRLACKAALQRKLNEVYPF